MAEIIEFVASDEDRERVVAILERALEKARLGEIVDVAVVAATRDEDGSGFVLTYWGQRAYAVLLAGASALQFDLHHERYRDAGRT